MANGRSGRRSAVAAGLAAISVMCVCLFCEPAETALEAIERPHPGADDTGRDVELFEMLSRDANQSGTKVTENTNKLALRLQSEDLNYQRDLATLMETDKLSREKYLSTKKKLRQKVSQVQKSCKKNFAAKLQSKDPAYLQTLARLKSHQSHPKMVKAKASLKPKTLKLQKAYRRALKKNPSASKAIKNEFRPRFQALKTFAVLSCPESAAGPQRMVQDLQVSGPEPCRPMLLGSADTGRDGAAAAAVAERVCPGLHQSHRLQQLVQEVQENEYNCTSTQNTPAQPCAPGVFNGGHAATDFPEGRGNGLHFCVQCNLLKQQHQYRWS